MVVIYSSLWHRIMICLDGNTLLMDLVRNQVIGNQHCAGEASDTGDDW